MLDSSNSICEDQSESDMDLKKMKSIQTMMMETISQQMKVLREL